MRLQRRTNLVLDLAHWSLFGRPFERLHWLLDWLLNGQLLDLDFLLCPGRLLRRHIAVFRFGATLYVEKLRKIDRLLLAARPDLVGIVKVGQTRMMSAGLVVIGFLAVLRVAASVIALERHFNGKHWLIGVGFWKVLQMNG